MGQKRIVGGIEMIRLFDKGLDEATKQEVSKIATDDIKVNKLGFGQKTTLKQATKIIQISQGLLERCSQ